MYDDTNPNWSPSLHFGYDFAVLDDASEVVHPTAAKHNAESNNEVSMEIGVSFQTEKAGLCDAQIINCCTKEGIFGVSIACNFGS